MGVPRDGGLSLQSEETEHSVLQDCLWFDLASIPEFSSRKRRHDGPLRKAGWSRPSLGVCNRCGALLVGSHSPGKVHGEAEARESAHRRMWAGL